VLLRLNERIGAYLGLAVAKFGKLGVFDSFYSGFRV
jgi:hypothetical protein